MLRVLSGPQNLVDQKLFTFILDREIHKAARLQYSLSVLCFTPDIPRGKADPTYLNRLARLGIAQLRATDLAAHFDPSCLAVLLVDAEAQDVRRIFHRLKERVEPISPQTLSAGAGCFPQTVTGARELIEQAIELMKQAKAEGGNRLKLPPPTSSL